MTSNPDFYSKNRDIVLNQETLISETSIKEEVDCLFLKKIFLDACTLLMLKKTAYVCGLSKSRAHMYMC
jgi:hypothetical protein